MKKFVSIILTLTILASISLGGVSAVEVGYNGMYFEVDSKTMTAILVDYDGTDTSLSIPREVHGYEITEIADRAFFENNTLEYIYVPYTVNKVGSYAFSDCTALDEVHLPSSVTSMGDAVFLNSTKLSKVTMYCNIEELPFNTFGSCTSLVDVELGRFISKIGASAFSDCTSLKNIPLNENIVAFGSNAFRGSGVEEVVIPSTVTELTWYSFANCDNLTKVTIGKNVETIDSTAFKNCNNVTIYCYKNSVAHNFASNKNIPYVILDPYDLGDVDLSGVIDIKDSTSIQKYLAEIEMLDDTQLSVADFNQDGGINIIDATAIQKYLVS